VSSPNEPTYPRAGDNSGTNGSAGSASSSRVGASTTGHITDSGDVPPWQRGRANRQAPQAASRAPETPARQETRQPSAERERTNRHSSGPSAPSPADETLTPPPPSRNTERVDSGRPDAAYASELPDLSGPVPRPPQRKAPADRTEPATRSGAAPASRLQVGRTTRGPVRASMQIRRIDPWSTLKVALVLSVALFFVWMIAVAFLYLVLGGMGVWTKLNSNVGDLLTSASGASGGDLVSSGTIFGGAALIGLVNIVLLTAMATAAAFIYNLTTDLVGGVEVTLADRD
jgi:Transmembrane domain of unknown function (DUF3566)